MTSYRPDFNHKDVEDACPHNPIQTNHPRVLEQMRISSLFIRLAEDISKIYESNPQDCSFEIVMIAVANRFVQYEVDINDPDMIREFMVFFQSMFERHAVRYVKDGKSYINANLGEFHGELKKLMPKSIAHVTGFATEACLTREKDADECTNHIDHGNHSIDYQRDVTLNTVKSILDLNVTNDSFETIVDERIAFADIHIRSGTIGKGNSFRGFQNELNGDPKLSAICREFKLKLKLASTFILEKSSYKYCQPIVIDMLLGIFNFVLYALYVYAMTKSALRVFFASTRSHAIFEDDGENMLTTRMGKLLIAGFGIHPNAVEANLTNAGRYRRPIEDVQLMDEGIAISLEPLDGCMVKYLDGDGIERNTRFKFGPSDAFQRIYNYRLSKKMTPNAYRSRRKELLSMNKKLIVELRRKQKELLSINKKIAKKQTKRDRLDKIKSDTEAKRMESNTLQNKEYAALANKRTKMGESALDTLLNF